MLGSGALLAHLEPLKVTGLHLHHLCVVQHVKGSELLTECCTPRCPRPELGIHSFHPSVLPSRWQIRKLMAKQSSQPRQMGFVKIAAGLGADISRNWGHRGAPFISGVSVHALLDLSKSLFSTLTCEFHWLKSAAFGWWISTFLLWV